MPLQEGDFNISTNVTLRKKGTWDSRQYVDSYTDLFLFTEEHKIPYGFPVACGGQGDLSKLGVWQCVNPNDLSNPLSWVRGNEPIPFNQVIQVGSYSFNDVTYVATLGETLDWGFNENGVNIFVPDTDVQHTAPDATFPRVDIISWNSTDGYVVTEGTPSNDPDVPNTPVGDIFVRQILRNIDGTTESPEPPDLSGYAKLNSVNTFTELQIMEKSLALSSVNEQIWTGGFQLFTRDQDILVDFPKFRLTSRPNDFDNFWFLTETSTGSQSGVYSINYNTRIVDFKVNPTVNGVPIGTGGGGASNFADIGGEPYDNTNLASALNLKADDLEVVHNTGNEDLSGTKTFTEGDGYQTKVDGYGIQLIDGTKSSYTSANGISYQDTNNNKDFILSSAGLKIDTLGNVASEGLYLKSDNVNTVVTLQSPNASGTIARVEDLASKLDSNTAITGATKTKITYDAKGLVTAGADATTADIADSTDKRYVTEDEKTKLSRTITGTTNRVTVTNGDGIAGNPTLTLPQDIHTGATPQFARIGLGASANVASYINAIANTSTVGQLYLPPSAVDYTGTLSGMLWNNTSEWKFYDGVLGSVNRFIKLNGNSILANSNSLNVVTSTGTGGNLGTLKAEVAFGRYPTAVSYTVLLTDVGFGWIIAVTDTSAARTITLPLANTVPAGWQITIKDESGAAGTNNITIALSGSDTTDTTNITTNGGSRTLYSDGVSKWFQI